MEIHLVEDQDKEGGTLMAEEAKKESWEEGMEIHSVEDQDEEGGTLIGLTPPPPPTSLQSNPLGQK